MRSFTREIAAAVRSGSAGETLVENGRLLAGAAKDAARAGFPRAYAHLAEELSGFLTECARGGSESPTGEELYAFLRARNFSCEELDALPACLKYLGIKRVREICAGRAGREKLPAALGAIRFADDPDCAPDLLFAAGWKPEALLRAADPSYAASTPGTRATARRTVARKAKKEHLSETAACEELLRAAEQGGKRPCDLLYPRRVANAPAKAVWAATFLLTFGVSLAAAIRLFGATGLLLAVPLAEAFLPVCDRLASKLDRTPPAPRLKLGALSDEGRTVVAVTALLDGTDPDPLSRLEKFLFLSPKENVFFCLAADFAEAGMPSVRGDEETLRALQSKIDELNARHGDRFFLFWRDRELLEGGRYGGKERKRGAIGALLARLRGEPAGNLYGKAPENARFLLTLDADTEFSPGFLQELLGVALHPANRDRGVFQPAVQTGLLASYRTRFTRLMSGSAGGGNYEHAVFDRSMLLFGEGIFCGKGLLRIDRFRERALSFPDGKILSHDVLEGGRAGTLATPDLTLYDGIPGNPISWNRRAHRWIRGDFQNLAFLGDRRLSPAVRVRIVCNVLSHLTPWFALKAILSGALFLREETRALLLVLFACSYLLVPFLTGLLSDLYANGPLLFRRALTRALSAIAEQTFRLCTDLVMLCRNAYLALDACFRAAWRMLVSHRRLLEWTTAARAERDSSRPSSYIADGVSSFLTGTLLFLAGGAAAYRLIGLVFFLYPPVAWFLSRPPESIAERRPLSAGDRAMLQKHAAAIWSFFAENVNARSRHLPPDNRQYSPKEYLDLRTSPTNVGLYLLSVLAAMDLGLCDAREGASRLEQTLSSVEGLPKYRGNLYNWYDLTTARALGTFVSFVDSGNLVVSLVTLSEGLKEYADADERFLPLAEQAKRLADETDLSLFFDEKRNLFSLGIDASTGALEKGCYDRMMSEARTASYYAVAAGIAPASHWNALSRSVSSHGGYVGMCSWSGTAFEYLMPQLFLPCYPDSFFRETFLFALSAQKRAAHRGLWGISESGYYGFDSELRYRYRAHGVRELALREDCGAETVFSPYSAYLFLSVSPTAASRALREWESETPFGQHGLYEAIDFSPERDPSGEGAVVKSYMAHHLGMSLLACANALRGDLFVRRFFSDGRMASAESLLQEKVPPRPSRRSATFFRGTQTPEKLPLSRPETSRADFSHPRAALLTAGRLSLCAGSLGHLSLLYDGKAVFDTRFERFSASHTPSVFFTDEKGETFGCTPFFRAGACSFETSPERIAFVCSGKRFSGTVRCSFSRLSEVLRIEAAAEKGKAYRVAFAFRPVLQSRASYDSHRSFSRLFLRAEYDETERILYYSRRSRESGKPECFLAAALSDETRAFTFRTDEKGLPAERDGSPERLLSAEDDCRAGICTEPFCLLRTSASPGGKVTLLLAPAPTREAARNAILTARRDKTSARSFLPEKTSELLTAICYPAFRTPREPFSYRRAMLWEHGISGDEPLLSFSADEYGKETANVLSAWNALSRAGIRSELLCVPKGDGQYFRPAEKKFLSVCETLGLTAAQNGKGGFFLLRPEQTDPALLAALPAICRVTADDCAPAAPLYEFSPPVRRITTAAAFPETPPNAIRTACGYADEDGFLYDRSAPAASPMSYLLAGKTAGSVLTASSLGYTFVGNARERRLTPALCDFGDLPDGEILYLRIENTLYDLAACASSVRFSHGTATWTGTVAGISYSLLVFVDPSRPFKAYRVRTSAPCERILAVRVALGGFSLPNPVFRPFLREDALCFRSGQDPAFDRGIGFLYAGNAEAILGQSELFTGVRDAFADLLALRVSDRDTCFLLGGCDEDDLPATLREARSFRPEPARKAAVLFAKSFLPPLRIRTRSPALDLFLTAFLPYQIAASRFYCRASFRQSGGAFGFRDQLQDCLSLVYSDPKTVREHLLRCCSRQYEEGDVQHWWHENGVGIRTACSDDLLWLPYAVADYLEKTGDLSLLHEQAPYLSSPPLENETERCETPRRSYLSETVLLHVLRAFAHADRRGAHGLILMGSCDWNDAFSAVGVRGKGESVFSAFLYIVAANRFLPFLRAVSPEQARALQTTAEDLLSAAETHAWAGDRWIRAFCDDGEILGVEGRSECAIDILTQAFALFAGADETRCRKALDTAEKRLYDPAHKLLSLFDPPFENGNTPVGYVRGYPPGVRENGGQYTHAAVWGAIAFLRVGKTDTALDLLTHMNPLTRTQTVSDLLRYRSEPYALCADVYTGSLAGMGGWSWYTGSAAWLYKAFREEVFGLFTFDGGARVDFRPRVPCTLTLSLRPGTTLTLRALPASTDSPAASAPALLDGIPTSLPCAIPDGAHTLVCSLRQ